MSTALRFKSVASVETPDATYGRLYYKTSDKKPYFKNEDGTDYDLSGGGGSGDISADTLTLNDGSELTIATGAVTVTAARHTVDTESDAASDDLDTVNGLSANEVCFITANNASRTVNITNGVGNITTATGNTIALDDAVKGVLLMGNTAGAGVIAYPVNGGSGGGGGIGGSTGATDNRLLRANGTGGSTLQNSAASVDDDGRLKTTFFGLPTVTELTIATGAITATQSYHSIDTESDAASDDLDTISGGSAGDRLYIFPNNDSRTVVIKNGTGNIFTYTGQDITLDEAHKHLELLCDGTNWYEVSSSGTIAGTTGATDNAIPRANGTGGFTLQGSAVTIDDNNRLSASRIALPSPTELTISSGSVTTTQMYHSIDTESDAATDDLDTIAGGSAGDVLYIYAVNDARTVVVKNGTGNIFTYSGDDIDLDEDHKRLCLLSDGTNWHEVGNVKEGAGGGGTPDFGSPTTKTLSSDDIAAGSDRNIVVAAQTGTADELHEITGLSPGDKVLLTADAGDDIDVIHNEGSATMKILTLFGEAVRLSETYPTEFLCMSASALVQVRPASLPCVFYTLNEASNYTTTSTSFVDVDATNLALTIETTGGDLEVRFSGPITNSSSATTSLDVDLDGTRVAGDDGITGGRPGGSAPGFPFSFVYVITDVEPGSHTLKLMWKVAAGTGTLYAGAGTAFADHHPQFSVKEL